MPRAHVHTAMASLVLLTSVAVPAGAAPRDATPRDLTPPAIGAPLAATPSELPATTRQPGETPGEPTNQLLQKGSKVKKQLNPHGTGLKTTSFSGNFLASGG